jgi:hypothetical protein
MKYLSILSVVSAIVTLSSHPVYADCSEDPEVQEIIRLRKSTILMMISVGNVAIWSL